MTPCFIISPFTVAFDSFPGGTHYLTEKVSVGPLTDEYKSRIVEYLDSKNEEHLCSVVRRRPGYVVPFNEIPCLRSIVKLEDKEAAALQMHRFSLEYFSDSSIPMAIFTYNGSAVTAHSFDRDDLIFREERTLSEEAWNKHAVYLSFLYGAISSAPAADIVMGRLSRAFRQGPNTDGIIDLSIALECLVNAQTEIKFQFSLYHSLINSSDPENRQKTFRLLKDLYDIRSITVHGSKLTGSNRKKHSEIEKEWGRFIEIARQNLTYYLVFCQKNGGDIWNAHLQGLALGQNRINLDETYD